MPKEFNYSYINERYETGDIVSYKDLYYALGDGYGNPGNVQIATLDNIGWYPCGFCSRADGGVWDCDETKVFPENEYGKTWIGVCSANIDNWAAAHAGVAFLLDIASAEKERKVEPKMEKRYIFGNWYIHIITDNQRLKSGKPPVWMDVLYQAEAPETEEDVAPDWGFCRDGNSIKEAAISCIDAVWHSEEGRIEKAVEFASAMIALGIIPSNCLISDQAALIDGRWFFGEVDEHKRGVSPWNEFAACHNPNEYEFSKEGQKLAERIISSAVDEYEEFERGYLEWEATWIDGIQG